MDQYPEGAQPEINSGDLPAASDLDSQVNAQPWILRTRLTQTAFIAQRQAAGQSASREDWMRHIELSPDEIELLNDLVSAPIEGALADLSPNFIIRAYGDKARVGWFDKRGDLATMSFHEFRNAHIEKQSQIGTGKDGKPVYAPTAKLWLEHKQTRRFDNVEFMPGVEQPNMPEGILNLWRGWPLGLQPGWTDAPNAFDGSEMPSGYCDLFLEHMREAMCGGDDELMHYLLGWMADGLWNPGPCETAIVLRGPEGSGKTLWSKHYMEFFGIHAVTLADPRHIIGNFNKQLMNKSVVFAEEAFFAGNGAHVAKLKSLVTDNEIIIEPKGVDSFRIEKMFRLIMASNDEHVIRAGRDDRRYLVLNVDAREHNQDKPYFAKLIHEWRHGGRSALFRWLTGAWWGKAVGNGAFRQWERPVTAALQAQKDLSLPRAQMVIHNMLREGEVPALHEVENGTVFLSTTALAEARRLDERDWTALGKAIGVLAGAEAKAGRKYLDPHNKARQFTGRWLPSLGECRRRWEAHLGRPVEWPDHVTEWAAPERPAGGDRDPWLA